MNILQNLQEWLNSHWFIIFILGFLYLYNKINTNIKHKTHDAIYLDNLNTIIKSNIKLKDILSELDDLIEEIGSYYILLNIIPKEPSIITGELESKMNKEIGEQVSKALSGLFITKMSLFFDKEYIPELVALHINLYITQYCMNTNSIKPNKTSKTPSFLIEDE